MFKKRQKNEHFYATPVFNKIILLTVIVIQNEVLSIIIET